MTRYDTNLAGEFYALACLHRLGVTANLTLGNKKGVDIVVARKAGDAVTVEVKALAGKDYWPAQNLSAAKPDRHFIVLVSFDGKMSDPACGLCPSPRSSGSPCATPRAASMCRASYCARAARCTRTRGG